MKTQEKSIKKLITEYLEGKDWVFGGSIEDYIRSLVGAKASNASRRCRELENIGTIEARKIQINGSGPFCVQYKLRQYTLF